MIRDKQKRSEQMKIRKIQSLGIQLHLAFEEQKISPTRQKKIYHLLM